MNQRTIYFSTFTMLGLLALVACSAESGASEIALPDPKVLDESSITVPKLSGDSKEGAYFDLHGAPADDEE